MPNHVLTADVDATTPQRSRAFRDQLEGRSMIVVKTERAARSSAWCAATSSGSGWKDYQATGAVCGIPLPPGLRESDRLEPPIFTPATKAETRPRREHPVRDDGRDGGQRARGTRRARMSLEIYRRARAHAEARGIILADTKFEFGVRDGRLVWIDEALTPDSSRFWPRDGYAPGRSQPSFDKQFVRDYLETLRWDKQPPGPELPPDVVARTRGEVPGGVRAPPGAGPLASAARPGAPAARLPSGELVP